MSALSDSATSMKNYATTLVQMAKVLNAKADILLKMDASLGQIISAAAAAEAPAQPSVPTVPYTVPDVNAVAPVQSIAASPNPSIVTDIGGGTIETAMSQHTDVAAQ